MDEIRNSPCAPRVIDIIALHFDSDGLLGVHVLSTKSRSEPNRGPYIHYYVDEDHDLVIHNIVCKDRDFARTAVL